jgi:hypothetical protein
VFCLLYARCASDAYTATYPTVLTIVHLDGTSILSLYTTSVGTCRRMVLNKHHPQQGILTCPEAVFMAAGRRWSRGLP